MSPEAPVGRSIEEVLDLLKDPAFCDDVRRFIAEAAAFREQASTPEKWLQRMLELREPFVARWGVPPPQTRELVDHDSRRQPIEAIGSGCWGIVPVFAWTTDREILALVKTIRRRTRRQHQDTLDRRAAQLVGWLQACGFDRAAIARVIFTRRTGLRRPTRAEAIRRTPDARESELVREYRRKAHALGIPATKLGPWVDRHVYRKLRGSEARASAAVRMADRRYLDRIMRLNEDLASPIESEPLSHALTMLFAARFAEDDAGVRRCAADVRIALISDSENPLAPSQPRSVESQARRLAAIESQQWGVVVVFPWTTNPVIRACVKKIRTKVRRPRQDSGGRPSQPSAPFTEPEPFSPALRMLVRALDDEDDAAVKFHAEDVQRSFSRAFSS